MRWTIVRKTMNHFIACYILLASITLVVGNDVRPKRDLAYIKNLITSSIFGDCDTEEVRNPKQNGIKLYRVSGLDDILIKAIPKVSRPELIIETVPRPIITQEIEGKFEDISRPIGITRVQTPVEMKYSYEQQKPNGFTTTYTSRNGGDVFVTETKTIPPLPPYVTRRMQDILFETIKPGMRNPIRSKLSHPVLKYQQTPHIGAEAVFHPIKIIEDQFTNTPPSVFAYPNMNSFINTHQDGITYGDVVSPTMSDYNRNIYNQPMYNVMYPYGTKLNLESNDNPRFVTNEYSYKVIKKDGTSTTYLGSVANDNREKNIHTIIAEKKNTVPLPPAFIADRIKETAHPIPTLDKNALFVRDNMRIDMLPALARESNSINKKMPIQYVYIPPVDVNAGTKIMKKENQVTKFNASKANNVTVVPKNIKSATNIKAVVNNVNNTLNNKPIVVVDTKYAYKQVNADGSSISTKSNSDNQVSVVISNNNDDKRGRGDIP